MKIKIFSFILLCSCTGQTMSDADRIKARTSVKTLALGSSPDKVVSLEIPDDLKAAAGSLVLGEGSTLAGDGLTNAIKLDSPAVAAGPSVNIQGDPSLSQDDIGRLKIELPFDQELSLAQIKTLAIAYAVKDADNQTLVGLILQGGEKGYTINNSKIKFALRGFGNYQPIRVEQELKEEKVVVSDVITTVSKAAVEALVPINLSLIEPTIVQAGDQISLVGSAFRASLRILAGGLQFLDLNVANAQSVSARVPSGLKIGEQELVVVQDGKEVKKSFFFAGSGGDLPVITLDPDKVCKGIKYYNGRGESQEGSRSCDQPPTAAIDDCSSSGQRDCKATGDFVAAKTCGAGGSNCYLPEYNESNQPLIAVSYKDILAKKTAIKAGVNIAGVVGTQKYGCKNRAHGVSPNFSLVGPPGSATIGNSNDGVMDWWDTIEDFNANQGFPTEKVPAFSTANDCNFTSWVDMTAGGCDDLAKDCKMKDLLTDLTWSETPLVSGYPQTKTWDVAINYCDNLNFGGETNWRMPTQKELMEAYTHGFASVGALNISMTPAPNATSTSTNQDNHYFNRHLSYDYWSATSASYYTVEKFTVNLAKGLVQTQMSTSNYAVICVTP